MLQARTADLSALPVPSKDRNSHSHRGRHNIKTAACGDCVPFVLWGPDSCLSAGVQLRRRVDHSPTDEHWPASYHIYDSSSAVRQQRWQEFLLCSISSTEETLAAQALLLLLAHTTVPPLSSTITSLRFSYHVLHQLDLPLNMPRKAQRYEGDVTPEGSPDPSSDDSSVTLDHCHCSLDEQCRNCRNWTNSDNDRSLPPAWEKRLSDIREHEAEARQTNPVIFDSLVEGDRHRLLPTQESTQTTSNSRASPESDYQGSDSEKTNGLEGCGTLLDTSYSRTLNVVSDGHMKRLSWLLTSWEESTAWPASIIKMAAIITIVSSTSNENSTSKTCINFASDNGARVRAENALDKLIATYCRSQGLLTTHGTTLERTETLSRATSIDHLLEEVVQLETITGQAAFRLQTKKVFLTTLKNILRETGVYTANRFKTPVRDTLARSLRSTLPISKKWDYGSIGNGFPRSVNGLSPTSPTPLRALLGRQEDPPTRRSSKLRMRQRSGFDVIPDPDDRSPSFFTVTRTSERRTSPEA